MLYLFVRFLHIASAMWFIGGLNVPLIFLLRGKMFDQTLEDALARGEMTPALRSHLNDPVGCLAHGYEMISLVVVVFLMVFSRFRRLARIGV